MIWLQNPLHLWSIKKVILEHKKTIQGSSPLNISRVKPSVTAAYLHTDSSGSLTVPLLYSPYVLLVHSYYVPMLHIHYVPLLDS